MWRYVKEAFWTPMTLPLIGGLPVNAMAVAGFGLLGFAEHAFWLVGAGLETAYLYVLATNPRFQNVVNARELARTRRTDEQSRGDLLAQMSPEGRARLERLEGKLTSIATLYRTNGSDNLLLDSSLDALKKLSALHGRLLVAEHHLQTASREVDEAALARQEAALASELADGALSASLRESKQATLELTRKRAANARRRAASLAEIASDLARIEAQVDLALEDAGLEGKSPVAASNLNLLNQILESNSALGGGEIVPDYSLPSSGSSTTRARDRQTEAP